MVRHRQRRLTRARTWLADDLARVPPLGASLRACRRRPSILVRPTALCVAALVPAGLLHPEALTVLGPFFSGLAGGYGGRLLVRELAEEDPPPS